MLERPEIDPRPVPDARFGPVLGRIPHDATRGAAVLRRRLGQGSWHRCPACGVVDTAEVGHCADGRYGGCGRSFSSDEAFDAHHWYDDDAAGRWVCEDPGSLLTKDGRPRFVARPSPVDGHPVWGKPGSRPPQTSRGSDDGPENGAGVLQ